MPQIFKPSANNYARTSIVMGVVAPVALIYCLGAFSRSGLNTKVGIALSQPVPFSHTHHTWEIGLDCRYCHTGVEKSPYAGLPPTETCMSCHSQIWTNSPLLEPIRQSYETGTPIQWTKVNKVPEFVFFNHSIHINRGVNCNVCHGAIQDMPITSKGKPFQMQWCLECHRSPEKYLYRDEKHPEMTPRQQVFNLYWKMQSREELSEREQKTLESVDIATNDPVEVEKGRKIVNTYGVKVQQLADCAVCHH